MKSNASASWASLNSTLKQKGLDGILNDTFLNELMFPNMTLEFKNLEKTDQIFQFLDPDYLRSNFIILNL